VNALALATQIAEPVTSATTQNLQLGQDHYTAGKIDDAVIAFQAGLDAAGWDSTGSPALMIAGLHADLGNAHMQRGHLNLASGSYRAALRLAPHLTSCWCSLGDIHLKTGRAQEAIPLYLQALKLDPAHWEARINLVEALMTTRQYPAARALLQQLREERPQVGQTLFQLGKVCFALNETESALRHFERAIALNPDDVDSRYWIGGVKHRTGDLDAARAAYAVAEKIRPLVRRQAIKTPAAFRLLALYAPYGGNTPIQYLFRDAPYDIDTLAFFGPDEPDISSLGEIHAVINLISEADQAEAMLPAAARLAEKLGKPVINAPDRIPRWPRGCRSHSRFWPGRRAPTAVTISKKSKVSTSWRAFSHGVRTTTITSSNMSTTPPATGISASTASSSSATRYCPTIWRSEPTGRCTTFRPIWPASPGCNRRRRRSSPIPPRSSGQRIFRRFAWCASASGSTISASTAGSIETVISSSSRSTPRCWSTTTTRSFPTRTPSSAPSRPPSAPCCETAPTAAPCPAFGRATAGAVA